MLRLSGFALVIIAPLAAQAAEPWYIASWEDHTCKLASHAPRDLRTPAAARSYFRQFGMLGDIKTLPEGSDQPVYVEFEVHMPAGNTLYLEYTRGLATCQIVAREMDKQENLAGLK